MKNKLLLLLIALCVVGCGRPSSSGTSSTNSVNANSNSATSAPKIAKVFDLPATLGKSREEIKKMVSGTPKHENPWLEYDLPEYELTFKFDKEKASEVTFKMKSQSVGSATISGVDTAEQLATMAGIDIKGKSPKSTGALGDTYEHEIDGKKGEMTFFKVGNKFNSVMIEAD